MLSMKRQRNDDNDDIPKNLFFAQRVKPTTNPIYKRTNVDDDDNVLVERLVKPMFIISKLQWSATTEYLVAVRR